MGKHARDAGGDFRAADAAKAGASSAPIAGQAPPDDLTILERIVEGTGHATGEAFLQSLVRSLASVLNVRYAFVAEFAGVPTRVRTLAFWAAGRIAENVEWDLAGTPCEEVVAGRLCHHPAGVSRLFPRDAPLVEMRIESYLGVPLIGARGETLGHLAVFDERPMPHEPRGLSVFRIFAQRAGAELDRLHTERSLRESERQFRDLFEQAPIGYVYEDTETRFLSANSTALKMLGVRPEEVRDTVGLTLVADTPENQARVRQSIAAEQAGRELPCIELELRRKDNGRPVWVQRWSRPEPGGRHTRTMIIDITERVLAERERSRLQQQNVYLQEEIKSVHNFEEIVGRSAALREVLAKVELVAGTEATVLITGETGVGKELIARAIHSRSRRAGRPLIKVNCAALPTGLVESELFGHEKGAFTGAVNRRIGRFELAEGGTIFLDEIGELPLDVQVKLLRILQEREFERIGGAKTIRADVRIIAATNRDLPAAIASGAFRQDLYYRLNVFPLHAPALRERREDIPLLVHYFVKRSAAQVGRAIEHIAPHTLKRLIEYDWPGNVRELENIVERAVILSPGPELLVPESVLAATAPVSAAAAAGANPPLPGALDRTLEQVEREHIIATLQSTKWLVEGEHGAARSLGLHPNTLRSRMKRLGIQRSAEAAS